MRITYRQLQKILNELHPEQLDCDVTVEVDGEFFSADLRICGETDVLDENHPVIFAATDTSYPSASNVDVEDYIKNLQNADRIGPIKPDEYLQEHYREYGLDV